MADTWRDRDAGEFGLGFTLHELEANRRGLLLAEQYPPLFWKVCGLCITGLAIVLCLRLALQRRHDGTRYIVAGLGLGLACLVPAWPIAGALVSALWDRMDARACTFTHVSSGVRESNWGLGLYYVELGHRAFPSRRGSVNRAEQAVQADAAYTAYYACQSGTLASLEPAPPDWKWPTRAEHLAELKQLFSFDDQDLAANWAGLVTFHQFPIGGLLFVLSFGGLLLATGMAGVKEFIQKRTASMLLLGLVFTALSAGVVYINRSLFQDALTRRACTLAGTVTNLSVRVRGKNTTYWRLTLDTTTLEFARSTQGISLVRVGSPYRVHYLCHSQDLVSIEPLS